MGIEKKIIIKEIKLNGDKYIFLDDCLVQEAVAIKLFPEKQILRFYSENIPSSKRLPTDTFALKLYFNRQNKVKRYEQILRSHTY